MSLSIERTHLDGLVMFLAVAELRGFRPASRQLGVTPSAVSQAIRSLEERIGSPLFSRTTRSVGLTEAGERLLAHARPAVDMLTAGLEAASNLGGQISGRLRVNVPRASLPLLVNRLLPGFVDLHPDVQLELVGDDRMIDIVDAGVRCGNSSRSLRRDGHGRGAVDARRTLRRRRRAASSSTSMAAPSQPRDLQDFRCILLRQSARLLDRWQFSVDGQRVMVGIRDP